MAIRDLIVRLRMDALDAMKQMKAFDAQTGKLNAKVQEGVAGIGEFLAKVQQGGKGAVETFNTLDASQQLALGTLYQYRYVLVTVGAALTAVAAKALAMGMQDIMIQQKFKAAFGDQTRAMEKWVDTAAWGMGMSNDAAKAVLATYSAMVMTLGGTAEQSAELSKSLMQAAYSVALFRGQQPEEVAQAFQMALWGVTRAVKRYGIDIEEESLATFGLEQRLIKSRKELEGYKKAQVIVAKIMHDTAYAQDLAGQATGRLDREMAKMKATTEDFISSSARPLAWAWGKVLVPVNALYKRLSDNWFAHALGTVAQGIAGIVGPLMTLGGAVAVKLVLFFQLLNLMKSIGNEMGPTRMGKALLSLRHFMMHPIQSMRQLILGLVLHAKMTWASVKAIWAKVTALWAKVTATTASTVATTANTAAEGASVGATTASSIAHLFTVGVLELLTGATIQATVATVALNAALMALGIGLIIAAIVGLVKGIQALIKHWKTVWEWIKKVGQAMLFIAGGPIVWALAAFGAFGAKVKKIFTDIGGWFVRLFSKTERIKWDPLGEMLKNVKKQSPEVFAEVQKLVEKTKAAHPNLHGQEMMEAFAKDIRNASTTVKNAVSVASEPITKTLEGHSPPKEGPLSKIDEWGATLMETFLSGIEQAKPGLIEKASKAVGGIFGGGELTDKAIGSLVGSLKGGKVGGLAKGLLGEGGLGDIVTQLTGAAGGGGLSNILGSVLGLVGGDTSGISGILSTVTGALGGGGGGKEGGGKSEGGGSGLGSILSLAGTALGGPVGGAIGSVLGGLLGGGGGEGGGILDTVMGLLGGGGGGILDAVTGILGGGGGGILDAVTGLLGGGGGDLIGGLVNSVGGLLGGLFGGGGKKGPAMAAAGAGGPSVHLTVNVNVKGSMDEGQAARVGESLGGPILKKLEEGMVRVMSKVVGSKETLKQKDEQE